MLKKRTEQLIYKFMTLLILINSITPLKVFAETTHEPSIKLGTLTQAEGENQLELSVHLNDLQEEAKITASAPIIQEAVLEKEGQSTRLVLENNQVMMIPKTEAGEGIIRLTLNEKEKPASLELNFEEQQVSYLFETQSKESESESVTSTEAVSSQESTEASASEERVSETTAETQQSTESPSSTDTTSSIETQESVKKAASVEKREGPTDIRTYFPEGNGTILTDSKMVFLDDKGNIVEPPITPNSTVRIAYNWRIPEEVRKQIEPGDYFDFKLPDGLTPKRALTGELKNDEGDVYAKYTIDTEGNIRFTFTEEVKNQSDIEGRFSFDTTLKTEHIDGPGDIKIHYPVEDDLPPVTIEIRPNTEKTIDKQGHFDRTTNPNHVEWTVDFNQAMNHLEDATITESWPAGIEFQSVKVMELLMNLDGSIKGIGEELDSSQYTVDQNGNVKILGETNKAYHIVYQTKITDSVKPENGGKLSFTNTAKLTDKNNGDGIDAKATVTTNYGKPVEKNMVGYDSTKQEFNWAIKYNYNQKKISQKDASITDTISKNMSLVDRSVKLYAVSFNEQGNEVKDRELTEGKEYVLDPNPSGNGFVVRFLNDLDQAVRVEYKTKVTGVVTDPTQVTNNVSTGTGQTGSDKGTAQQQNVIKKIADIDYGTQKVGWRIAINKNNYEMHDLTLKDTYSPTPGLSMSIGANGEYDFKIRDVTKNKLLTPGEDYELTLVKDETGNELGFNVTFKNNYSKTSSEFEITYHTRFDVKLLDPTKPGNDRFKNNMAANWTDEYNKPHTSNDDEDFRPVDPYQLNAQKSGRYNAQTKKITWTIAVNHGRIKMNNANLVDPIKENQQYVDHSIKVYEAEVRKDGTVVKKQPEKVVNTEMKRIVEPGKGNNQTLTVDFPEDSEQTYLIEFETSLEGKTIEASKQYTNIAEYENNQDKRKVTGEVGVKHGGKFVQKSGAQNSQNPDYVNWKAIINPSQSTLNNVVIKDQPSDNQVIDQASIRLYETQVAENGTVTPNYDRPLIQDVDYSVDLTTDNATGKQVLTIKLLKEIRTAYQLEYNSYITSSVSGNKDKVSNRITVTGENDKVISGGEGKDVTVEIHHSSGSATGKKGKLTIQKTEADGLTKLAGARFQLWNTTKTQLLREGEVNHEGQLTFGNLPYGEYLLVETDAPEGFTISDELAAGRRVTINDQTSAANATPSTIPNERNKVILQKTDENGRPITFGGAIQKGARFKLEYYNRLSPENSLWEEVALKQDRVDSNGRLEIDSLPLGLYRITEIEAPTGYLVNADPTHFRVFRNEDHQVPTINLEYTNYQGKAELTKKDTKGNPLSGAEFDVLDSKGNKVNQQPLISQKNGKVVISGLAPGDYTFIETKAPQGYVLNTKKLPFTIVEKEHGEPDMVTTQTNGSPLELINYQGSVEFLKKDKNGDRLEGTEFNLLNDQNVKINQQPIVSDKVGKVHVDHLAPGTYTFVETKAPEGYLINEKRVTFTIKKTSNGAVPTIELADFINYQGSFQIIKRNTELEPLEGAEFTLYDQDKKVLDKKVESDKDGKVLFDQLKPGKYYFQETKAPKVTEGTDYVVNPALIEVSIPSQADGEPETKELGDFHNFRGKAQITKVGEGSSIAGAEFELTRISDGNEQYVKTIVTPEDGVLNLSGLGAGSYKLKETKAAPGYVINEQPIYFVVQENDDKNPTIDNLNFENYQSEIIGHKKDQNNKGLAEAEYHVFAVDEQNQVTNEEPLKVFDLEGEETDTIRSDENGEIYFRGLGQGRYILVETKAPKGFIKDTTPHPFEINSYLGKPEKIELADFINYQGAISVTKKDPVGHELAGAEFEVRDQSGNVQTVLDAEGKATEKLISGKDGKVTASGLAPGKYELIETQAPKHYLLNKEPIAFEIMKESQGKPETIVLADFVNYQGSVELKKVTEEGQGLAGAVFELHKEDGAFVSQHTTDKEGMLHADQLAPGNYYLIETKAPAGYVIESKKVSFTILKEHTGQPEKLVLADFVNYQGSVELKKVSEEGQGLADAVFELHKEDGTIIDRYATNKAGLLRAEKLAPGKYYLSEVKAPSGYELSKEKRTFEIPVSTEGKPKIINAGLFINQRTVEPNKGSKPYKGTKKTPKAQLKTNKSVTKATTNRTTTTIFPQTNDTKSPWLSVSGIVAIMIAGVVYLKRKN